jgi:membrane associated rhomboid family serine protease
MEISAEKKLFKSSVLLTSMLIACLWIIWFCDAIFNLHLAQFGVHPMHFAGLLGILTMPFIHDVHGVGHILSNSISMLVLLTILLNTYPRVAFKTILIIQFISGLLVWFFASPNQIHIGASAVIFGIASFLFISGILRRDRVSIAVSFFVGLFYSGSISQGLFPTEVNISWQGHLAGILSGIFCAIIFRNVDLPVEPTLEDDETDSSIDQMQDIPFFQELDEQLKKQNHPSHQSS